MSEATEAYLVSIFSGSTVVRTINVSGTGIQTATYTLAQQIADFGGSGLTSITFGVQQISAVTGPGVMAKATIVLPVRVGVVQMPDRERSHSLDGTGCLGQRNGQADRLVRAEQAARKQEKSCHHSTCEYARHALRP